MLELNRVVLKEDLPHSFAGKKLHILYVVLHRPPTIAFESFSTYWFPSEATKKVTDIELTLSCKCPGKIGCIFYFHIGLSFSAVRKCNKRKCLCNIRCNMELQMFGCDWRWGLCFIQPCKRWQSETPHCQKWWGLPARAGGPAFLHLCFRETQGIVMTTYNVTQMFISSTLLAYFLPEFNEKRQIYKSYHWTLLVHICKSLWVSILSKIR